jgi:hypothetical protein
MNGYNRRDAKDILVDRCPHNEAEFQSESTTLVVTAVIRVDLSFSKVGITTGTELSQSNSHYSDVGIRIRVNLGVV